MEDGLSPDQVLALSSAVSPAAGGNTLSEAPAQATSNGPSAAAHVGSATLGTVIGWLALAAIALLLGGLAKGG